MATPAEIVTALDTAILAWAGKPVSINVEGHQIVYRSLDELTRTRTYYQTLVNSASGASGLRFNRIQPPGGGPL